MPQNEPEDWKDSEDPDSFKATLVEHLDELRMRIVRSLLVLCIAWAVGWFLEAPIYNHLNNILRDPALWPGGHVGSEAFRNFADPFFLKFKLSFVIGLIIAGPVIIWQLWGFVRPALRPKERKPLGKIVPVSALLFLLGVFVGYIILKPAFKWFLSFLGDFEGTTLLQEPGTFVMFILKMVFAFGIGFQLPVVVWFMGSIGVITSEALWKNWRIAIAVIIFATAFLTPGGDFFSNFAMALPLTLLYFGSIVAVRITEKRRKRKASEDADDNA